MLQTQWNNSLASGVHKNIIIAAHFSQHEAERVRSSPLSEVGEDLLHLFVAVLREGDLVLQLLGVKLPGAQLGEVMDFIMTISDEFNKYQRNKCLMLYRPRTG